MTVRRPPSFCGKAIYDVPKAQFLGQLVLDREHLQSVQSVWEHRVTLWRKVTAHLQPLSQEETGKCAAGSTVL